MNGKTKPKKHKKQIQRLDNNKVSIRLLLAKSKATINQEGRQLLLIDKNECGDYIFILNKDVIKADYCNKYAQALSSPSNNIISDNVFPLHQLFNFETLDWIPIKKIEIFEARADYPGELHELWNKSKAIPQETPIYIDKDPDYSEHMRDYSRRIKTTTARNTVIQQILGCQKSIRKYNQKEMEMVSFTINMFIKPCQSNGYEEDADPLCDRRNIVKYFEEIGRNYYETIDVSSCFYKWILVIDNYILDVYNGKQHTEKENYNIRKIIESFIVFESAKSIKLILKRVIAFCKVIN